MMKVKITNLILLSAIILGSCMSQKSLASTTPQLTVKLPIPTATVLHDVAVSPTPPAFTYTEKDLSCEIVIDTLVGTYSPVFDDQGNMFIIDGMNKRISMYPKGENVPKTINLPELYTSDFLPKTGTGGSNISVANNKIFFSVEGIKNKRNVFRLFVLSMDNGKSTMIDLESYYPQYTIRSNTVLADKHGGVYVFFDQIIIHYDAELKPELITKDEISDFFNFIVGWDKNLYTYGVPGAIKNWGKDTTSFHTQPEYVFQDAHKTLTEIGQDPSMWDIFIGADMAGKLYFLLSYDWGSKKDEIDIVQLDIHTQTGVVGKIKNKDWLSPNYVLAPDGALYSRIIAPTDSSIQPKIIKCPFQ
jgi:hypothetical protein